MIDLTLIVILTQIFDDHFALTTRMIILSHTYNVVFNRKTFITIALKNAFFCRYVMRLIILRSSYILTNEISYIFLIIFIVYENILNVL